MKKTLLLLAAATLGTTGVMAQNNKRISAYNYYKDYKKNPELYGGDLVKAKEYIDACVTHEQTAGQPKTFYYQGMIYEAILFDTAAIFDNYKSIALTTAVQAYTQAIEVADKKTDTREINSRLAGLAAYAGNQGMKYYEEQKYNEAAKSFAESYMIQKTAFNTIDTNSAWNAAIMAENAGNNELAMDMLQICADLGYGEADPYLKMGNIKLSSGDTTAALEIYKETSSKFPQNTAVLNEMINIYLKQGKSEEATVTLQNAIAEDPNNATYHFVLGTLYEKVDNIDGAVAEYKTATELNPDYADAWYNMGAVYVNKGGELTEKMNALPMDAVEEYGKLEAERKELYKEAIAPLEMAYKYASDDLAIVQTLYQLYIKTGDTAKATEMKAILDAAKSK